MWSYSAADAVRRMLHCINIIGFNFLFSTVISRGSGELQADDNIERHRSARTGR